MFKTNFFIQGGEGDVQHTEQIFNLNCNWTAHSQIYVMDKLYVFKEFALYFVYFDL